MTYRLMDRGWGLVWLGSGVSLFFFSVFFLKKNCKYGVLVAFSLMYVCSCTLG